MDSAVLAELIPAFLCSSFTGIQKASHAGLDGSAVLAGFLEAFRRDSITPVQAVNILQILQQNVQWLIGSAASGYAFFFLCHYLF